MYGPSSDQFLAHYPEPKRKILALAGKLRLKLLYTARGIHKALLPGECRVGIHRDIAEEHVVVHPVDIFRLFGTGGGKGVKLLTG